MIVRSMQGFTSAQQALDTLNLRMQVVGVNPATIAEIARKILTITTSIRTQAEIPVAKTKAFDLIKAEAPISPSMLRVLLVQWVNELLGTAGAGGGSSMVDLPDGTVIVSGDLAGKIPGAVSVTTGESALMAAARGLAAPAPEATKTSSTTWLLVGGALIGGYFLLRKRKAA